MLKLVYFIQQLYEGDFDVEIICVPYYFSSIHISVSLTDDKILIHRLLSVTQRFMLDVIQGFSELYITAGMER